MRATLPSAPSQLARILDKANQAYNDAPKSSSRPRDPQLVLFMAEADSFVAHARALPKNEQRAVYADLARLSRTGEVAVTQNAASVLREYGRRLGAPVRLYAARLEY